ncbi:MAG: hypothetical protein NTV22_09220 [bacterium]|nr:hypothetical protein [bacterium]
MWSRAFSNLVVLALTAALVPALCVRADDALRRHWQQMFTDARAHMAAALTNNPGRRHPGVPVCGPLPAMPAARLAPPVNDNFANRTLLAGDLIVAVGTTEDATLEAGEPFHPYWGCGSNSIWYTWTAPYSGPFRTDVGASISECALAVFTNTTLATLARIHDGYRPFVSFDAVAGRTYQIVVVGVPPAEGMITLELYHEHLGPAFIQSTATNTTVVLHPLANGTVLLAAQDEYTQSVARTNQFLMVSRHQTVAHTRPRALNVIDRRGRYLLTNAVPPGVSTRYTVLGFNGRRIVLYDQLTARLHVFRLRRGTLVPVADQLLPNVYAGGLARRDIVAIQVDQGDGSREMSFGAAVFDPALAERWRMPLAPGLPVCVYTSAGIFARELLQNTAAYVSVYHRGEFDHAWSFPYPSAGGFIYDFAVRGEMLHYIDTGTWYAPTNTGLACYDRAGVPQLTNIILPGVGSAWSFEDFDGTRLLVSQPATAPASTLSAFILGRTVRAGGNATINHFAFAEFQNNVPVAYQYQELFDGVHGFTTYNRTLRRARWTEPLAAGDIWLFARGVFLRAFTQPSGGHTNFNVRIATRQGVIANHVFSY